MTFDILKDFDHLSFLEKKEGVVSDIGKKEIPLKSDNEDTTKTVVDPAVFELKYPRKNIKGIVH